MFYAILYERQKREFFEGARHSLYNTTEIFLFSKKVAYLIANRYVKRVIKNHPITYFLLTPSGVINYFLNRKKKLDVNSLRIFKTVKEFDDYIYINGYLNTGV
jgi:hypothetical protein